MDQQHCTTFYALKDARSSHKPATSYYIQLGMSSFTAYWWKQTTHFFLANFCFCFAVALKGLVCKIAVEHQIRYAKRVDLTTDVTVQVMSLVLGGVVYP